MISSLRRGSRSRLLLALVLTALFGPSAAHAQQRSAAYAGTRFWVDPKEQLVGVFMVQSASALRAYHRELFRQLVYQAIVD